MTKVIVLQQVVLLSLRKYISSSPVHSEALAVRQSAILEQEVRARVIIVESDSLLALASLQQQHNDASVLGPILFASFPRIQYLHVRREAHH